MSVEMAAVAFRGVEAAEAQLETLRGARSDAWLSDVCVLRHREDGGYELEASSPEINDEDKARRGLGIGAGTGALLGLVAGPLGIVFWGALGALAGAGIGASKHSAFEPLVEQVKDFLPRDASALFLLAESQEAEELVTATEADAVGVLREPLDEKQIAALEELHASVGA